MSLPKPLTLRHLCHLFNNILGLFYHRHIVFFTISLVKNTKCYLRVSNNLLSSSKRLQLPNPFLPLWNQLKNALGPAGNRSSPPWAWCTTALTTTLPCQLLISRTFFILPNRFLPLWNQRKRARDPAGNWSLSFRLRAPQHHNYTTETFFILPNPFLSLLSQLTLRLLFKGLRAQARNRSSLLGFLRLWEHYSFDHYNTMAKAERL